MKLTEKINKVLPKVQEELNEASADKILKRIASDLEDIGILTSKKGPLSKMLDKGLVDNDLKSINKKIISLTDDIMTIQMGLEMNSQR